MKKMFRIIHVWMLVALILLVGTVQAVKTENENKPQESSSYQDSADEETKVHIERASSKHAHRYSTEADTSTSSSSSPSSSTEEELRVTKMSINVKPPMPTRTTMNGLGPNSTSTTLESPTSSQGSPARGILSLERLVDARDSESDEESTTPATEIVMRAKSSSPKIISCANKTTKGSEKKPAMRFRTMLNVPLLLDIIDDLTNEYDNDKMLKGLNNSLLRMRSSKQICQVPLDDTTFMLSDAKMISCDEIVLFALIVYKLLF